MRAPRGGAGGRAPAAKLRQVGPVKRLGWQQAYMSRYETGERVGSIHEYVEVALLDEVLAGSERAWPRPAGR